MDSETFVRQIRKSIIADNLASYKDLFEMTAPKGASDPYWVRALSLYGSLEDDQKSVLFEIVRQVMSDTVSELKLVTVNGKEKLNGDLQDIFLEIEQQTDKLSA
jgi:hypothetical protein